MVERAHTRSSQCAAGAAHFDRPQSLRINFKLNAEYDHLTSDEAIEEGIIVNEYTFTEGGRRFG